MTAPSKLTSTTALSMPLTVTELINEARLAPSWPETEKRLKQTTTVKSLQLIRNLLAETHPLDIWWTSLQLLNRGIPPALHWLRPVATEQEQLLRFQADIQWLTLHYPERLRSSADWRHVLDFDPKVQLATWSKQISGCYQKLQPNWAALPNILTNQLNLTQRIRGELFITADNEAGELRTALQGDLMAWAINKLHAHAIKHRDLRRRQAPIVAANKNAYLYIIHTLTGSNTCRTTEYWAKVSGQTITRQAAAKHLSVAHQKIGHWKSRETGPAKPGTHEHSS